MSTTLSGAFDKIDEAIQDNAMRSARNKKGIDLNGGQINLLQQELDKSLPTVQAILGGDVPLIDPSNSNIVYDGGEY